MNFELNVLRGSPYFIKIVYCFITVWIIWTTKRWQNISGRGENSNVVDIVMNWYNLLVWTDNEVILSANCMRRHNGHITNPYVFLIQLVSIYMSKSPYHSVKYKTKLLHTYNKYFRRQQAWQNNLQYIYFVIANDT